MGRIWRKVLKGESGQALPITLALLIIGGLTIIPSLGLTFSSAKTSNIIQDGVKGTYAAEAGIEDTLWSLVNGEPPPSQLSDNINDMQVNIQTVDKGTHTLYLGELIEMAGHVEYLDVTSNITWDPGADAYKYTITVTWQPGSGEPTIHIEEIGARIPINYTYQEWSAANFTENISTDEPEETLDPQGAYLLNWIMSPPYPKVSENETQRTQMFYIDGTGEQKRYYAWVLARREDIGVCGEVNSTAYEITATALQHGSNRTAAKIITKAMIWDEDTYITSWQIHN
ncbi:MAG TPA: hypothetical protein G4O20_05775 [Dehalococcoidia bacterium]|nr:hypothetical protein [Dehalococcoidia bacterium]